MTHLLQPLDLTTNTSLKKIEKKTFSKYFSSSIIEALKEDPSRGDTTIKVNYLRLEASTCKCHEKDVTVFRIFERHEGDIEWMDSSRDNGFLSANAQEES